MKRLRRALFLSLVLGLMLLVAGCESPMGEATPAASPRPTGTHEPQGVIVTLRVADRENYKMLLTDPEDIEIARRLLLGEDTRTIPSGVVLRGSPGVNEGYSWHIDPATVEFADMTIEVCDGLPSDVTQGLVTSDRYCPWSAKVIAVDEVR